MVGPSNFCRWNKSCGAVVCLEQQPASQPANILETFLFFLGSDKHFSDSWLIGFKWTKEKKRSRNFNVFSSLFLIGGRWSLAFILLHFVLTMKKINKIVSMKLWRLFDHFVSILLVRLSSSSSKKSWQRWFLFETSEDFRRPLRFPGKPAADL